MYGLTSAAHITCCCMRGVKTVVLYYNAFSGMKILPTHDSSKSPGFHFCGKLVSRLVIKEGLAIKNYL